MNSKITKVSVVFLILFLVQDIGYSQNNNSKEYLKINVNVKHDEYSCSNPGCKNLIYKKSMTQINSINNENGGSFCVLPSLALLDLSYITAEANAKKYSKCNNTNFRNCNYNLISTLLEIATEYYTSEEDCQGLIDNPSFYGLNSNVYYITPAILLEQFFKRNTENSKKFKELYEREKIEDSIKKEQKLQKELLLQTFTKNLYEKKYYEADTILSFLINNNPFFNNQELGGFYYRWKAAWSNDLDKYLDLNDLENISKLISVFENKKIKITTSGYSYEREEEEKMLKYHKSTTIPFMQKLKELKSKELTPLEISFVGRWQFSSKTIIIRGISLMVLDTWVVNEDRSYEYLSKLIRLDGKETPNQYYERGMLEIITDSNGNIDIEKYITTKRNEYRVKKVNIDKISNKKATLEVNWTEVKLLSDLNSEIKKPIVFKGKKVK